MLLLCATLLLAAACRPDDQTTESISRESVRSAREDLVPALVAQLDSGNAALRANRFDAAATHFRRATEIDADHAAAWFGLYLSEAALGNTERAEEALSRARSVAPGASLLRRDEPVAPAPDS